MKLKKIYGAYFSPTGNTKKVVQGLLECFSTYATQEINLTLPEVRREKFRFADNDLLILGVPAYAGRMPKAVVEAVQNFRSTNTPIVLVVTYGNRAIDDTLMELSKVTSEQGFISVGAGVFVAEHSYLKELAQFRPDEKDMQIVKEFGMKLKERLRVLVLYNKTYFKIPGSYPYEKPPMGEFPFLPETNDSCIYCMLCANFCPMEAISMSNPKQIDSKKCVRCTACIRVCPTQAKYMTPEPFAAIQQKLAPLIEVRQEPWYVIC